MDNQFVDLEQLLLHDIKGVGNSVESGVGLGLKETPQMLKIMQQMARSPQLRDLTGNIKGSRITGAKSRNLSTVDSDQAFSIPKLVKQRGAKDTTQPARQINVETVKDITKRDRLPYTVTDPIDDFVDFVGIPRKQSNASSVVDTGPNPWNAVNSPDDTVLNEMLRRNAGRNNPSDAAAAYADDFALNTPDGYRQYRSSRTPGPMLAPDTPELRLQWYDNQEIPF